VSDSFSPPVVLVGGVVEARPGTVTAMPGMPCAGNDLIYIITIMDFRKAFKADDKKKVLSILDACIY